VIQAFVVLDPTKDASMKKLGLLPDTVFQLSMPMSIVVYLVSVQIIWGYIKVKYSSRDSKVCL
jgi:hypothetical protein